MNQIAINCDMGESYGRFRVGNDAAIMPFVQMANIACGFHGGDALHIDQTIALAMEHNVKIGAHPSYPDLQGFGRRPMQIPLHELKSIVKYQIAALKGMVESFGGQLFHVKPHGALYNSMASNPEEAKAVIEAIRSIDANLVLVGLAGSLMRGLCDQLGMRFLAEGFPDRRYEKNATLRARSYADAVITDPETAAIQAQMMIHEQKVQSVTSEFVALQVDTLCIHGDNPNAVEIAQAVHEVLKIKGKQKGAKGAKG